ncbi:MAG: heavy metal translocating P-type ATPase, partial [Nitrospirae bacterium]|nr:heavy metal translocating P-type ATPase [Nitrospirota bacterium]
MATSADHAVPCDHCLLPVAERDAVFDDRPSGRKVFCCHACRAIYRMIQDEGLGEFYQKREWQTSGIPKPLRTSGDTGPIIPHEDAAALATFIRGDGMVKEADLMIDGIRCASCIWLNEKVLERTPGIVSARVNFATHRALVRWDSSQITLGRILSRIRSIGYLARTYTPAAQEASLKQQNRDLLLRFGTASFFSMQLMLLSFGLYAGFFQGIDPVTKQWLEYGALLVCTPVLFYSGWPFLKSALRAVRNRTLNMDVLISLGAFTAYILSIRQMLRGGEVYFDTAAMIITLVLLGRLLESSAKHKASEAVSRLLALQPQDARLVQGTSRVIVPAAEVRKGDLIEILPGEKVPLDGIVRQGASEADESLVSGESGPVNKSIGSEVIGGSLNGLGPLVVEVTRIGQDTVIAQIARLVEQAQAATAPVQRFADRVSAYFIPFVLAASGLTFWYWYQQVSVDQSLL